MTMRAFNRMTLDEARAAGIVAAVLPATGKPKRMSSSRAFKGAEPATPAALKIHIPGEPVAKGRPRFGRGHTYTPLPTMQWEKMAAWTARDQLGCEPPLEGAVAITVEATFAIPPSWTKGRRQAAASSALGVPHISRPDGDNILKAVGDALNGVAWVDDSQIIKATVSKRYGDVPGVAVWVEAVS